MASRIAIRRDTALNWAAANPILASGEPALDTNSLALRYGDGVTPYLSLPVATGGSIDSTARTAAANAQATANTATTTANTANTTANSANVTAGAAQSTANDAVTAANAAQSAAISAAAADATAKVNAARYLINVLSYGATGNGTTSDTAAVQNAVNAAAAASKGVYFPQGTYLLSQVNLPSGMEICGHGDDSIIKQGNPTLSPFSIKDGTESLVATVSANVAQGATSIATSSSVAVPSPGDLIVLYDNYLYDPNDGVAISGEIVEVASASATSINLVSPVMGSFAPGGAYTTANAATIHGMNMSSNIYMHDLGFMGSLSAQQTPIVDCYYLRDSQFERLYCYQGGDTFISLKLGYQIVFRDNTIRNLTDDLANLHYGYGIKLSSANNKITVDGLIASNVRHAVTTGGGGKGISRNLIYNNIHATDCTVASGVDTHASSDHVLITNCVVQGCAIGITLRGRNMTVQNNTIRQCATGIRIAETVVANAVIKGNTIEDSSIGIDCSDAVVVVTVQANNIHNFSLLAMRFQSPITYLQILDNNMVQGQAGGIDVVSTVTRALIAGNKFLDLGRNAAGTAFAINSTTGSGGTGRLDIVNNTFAQYSNSIARAVNVVRATQVVNNTILGSALVSSATKWNVNGANAANNNEYA